MKKLVLVRFGEIFLKGLNRPYFIKMLVDRIKNVVNQYQAKVWFEDSRVYVSDFNEENLEAIISHIQKVFGVYSLSVAVELEDKNVDTICKYATELMQNVSGTFKVQAKRSDKKFPMDSPQINAHVGGFVLARNKNLSVDIFKPQHVLYVEVRTKVYLYTEHIPAVGGMPVGTNGKATLLLSGGIDSPVAGWMIAKRGVEINAVHFHSAPYTSERALQKVLDLAKIISESACGIKVHVIPFTEIQLEIHEKCQDDLTTLIMRRYMMKIAEKIALKEKSLGLITGESIGQVASQTMQALLTTDAAVNLPVYRPLIGFDKQDIIAIAEKIGTFETSSLPYEDCCTVFTPKHPKTKPNLSFIEKQETKLDEEKLLQNALSEYDVYHFDTLGNVNVFKNSLS
ncbi:MAG: tRNA uracil 4-sulfurtransferase ThiI [Eubacteriales bacterium]|nr:tRNA uracil 4-sulfurtransferase ThiI [Eubacteriales bacterium]